MKRPRNKATVKEWRNSDKTVMGRLCNNDIPVTWHLSRLWLCDVTVAAESRISHGDWE